MTRVGVARTGCCARPGRKQWVKNVLVFAAPGAAGVLDDWPELRPHAPRLRRLLPRPPAAIYFWNDALDVEADRLHPTKRFRPVAAGDRAGRHGQGRRHGARRRSASASPRCTGRWQTVAVVGVYVVVDAALQRRGSSTSPCIDIVTVAAGFVLRAAGRRGRRRRRDVELVRARHRVRLAVHRHRQALRRAARDRRGRRRRAGRRSPTTRIGYLRIVLTVSCGAALVSYCQWAFETTRAGRHGLAVLRAVDRADADRPAALRARPRAGPGRGAGGGLRQRPRAAGARRGLGRRVRPRRCTCNERAPTLRRRCWR